MSDAELLQEAKARYRVSGRTVEAFFGGKWIVAFYCDSEERAESCLEKCIERYSEWARMTKDERWMAILR